MSRCFPYAGKCSSNDNALIYSIKLQEEKQISIPDRAIEKAKSSDKKDRKREKKEKKKELKDKKRNEKELYSAFESVKQKHNDKLYKVDGLEKETIAKQSSETLERSNLTEEHGRPVDQQNVSCSSDSTGNSTKRKRLPSPAANSIQGNGNIIRIRLSKKRDDRSTSSCVLPHTPENQSFQGNLQPWSMSVSSVKVPTQDPLTCTAKFQSVSGEDKNQLSQGKLQPWSMSASSVKVPTQEPLACTAKFQSVSREEKKIEPIKPTEGPSTSGRIVTDEVPSKKLSSHERKMLKKETKYNKLFQNLLPPMMQTELLVADQVDEDDWLFGKKDEERLAKKLRVSSDDAQACTDNLSCSGAVVLQPRACFLPDVGVYALPFTVPF